MLIPVTDPADARLADYHNVPDPELIARDGVFVAEGRLVVARLLAGSRFQTRSVMVTRAALAALSQMVQDSQAGPENAQTGRQKAQADPPYEVLDPEGPIPVYVVPQALMNTVTGFNIHRGCLAIGVRPDAHAWTAVVQGARRVVALEGVSNADNVGGIFRNAAAFGVDGVLLGPACADPLYRKAIRTSMGAALSVPFAHAHPWPDTLDLLRDDGFAIVAMSLEPGAVALRDVARAIGGRPAVVLLGHEGSGLSEQALARSTHRARIPISESVDSLNVANAAAIAMYEMRVT